MARALAKSPEDRFRSAREFAAAAAAVSTSLTERSMPSTPRGAAVPIATRLPVDRLRSNASERSAGFREPIRIIPALPPRSVLRRPLVILWSIFAAVALIAAVVWARLLWPSSSAPEASVPATSTTATTSAAPAPAALGRARTDLSHVTKAGTQPNATEGP
jgi:serine/threonine-protein kinase